MISGARTISIHTGKQDFARTQPLDLLRPLYSIQSSRDSASININFPVVINPFRIDGDDNALAAKLHRALRDQGRIAHDAAVKRDLIRTRQQSRPDIFDGAQTAAHAKRNKDRIRHASHHVKHGSTTFIGRGDIEEGQFVGSFAVIDGGLLYWIASISEIDKINALDDPTIFYIEAWNNSFCQHVSHPQLKWSRPIISRMFHLSVDNVASHILWYRTDVHYVMATNRTYLIRLHCDYIKRMTISAKNFQFVTFVVAMNHNNHPHITCF